MTNDRNLNVVSFVGLDGRLSTKYFPSLWDNLQGRTVPILGFKEIPLPKKGVVQNEKAGGKVDVLNFSRLKGTNLKLFQYTVDRTKDAQPIQIKLGGSEDP